MNFIHRGLFFVHVVQFQPPDYRSMLLTLHGPSGRRQYLFPEIVSAEIISVAVSAHTELWAFPSLHASLLLLSNPRRISEPLRGKFSTLPPYHWGKISQYLGTK